MYYEVLHFKVHCTKKLTNFGLGALQLIKWKLNPQNWNRYKEKIMLSVYLDFAIDVAKRRQ